MGLLKERADKIRPDVQKALARVASGSVQWSSAARADPGPASA